MWKSEGRSSSLTAWLGKKFEKAQLFQKANGRSQRRYWKERMNAENLIYKRRTWREKR